MYIGKEAIHRQMGRLSTCALKMSSVQFSSVLTNTVHGGVKGTSATLFQSGPPGPSASEPPEECPESVGLGLCTSQGKGTWADGGGGRGRTPTETWDPVPGGRPPTPAEEPASPLAIRCISKAVGTGPGVPTYGHQHLPLEGVRKLPLKEHLQAEGCTGACQEPRSPSASLSTRC